MTEAAHEAWPSTGQGGSGEFGPLPEDFAGLDFAQNDRYTDLQLIASGGMGRVFRAFDRRLDRHVALKLVRAEGQQAEARLAHEARITARLDHPGVVPVHDVGRTAQGDPFYAMRLIRGRTFAALIREESAVGEGASPSGSSLRHFLSVCETVALAHSRGIVHLDLKPSNIMVGAFGETQVTDWGLAAELPVAAVKQSHPGTAAYMSPEQSRGESIDERADVWSLGAILHELLHGGPPHLAKASAALPELGAIAKRALSPQRAERYPSAAELAAEVSRWLDGQLVEAYSYSRFELLRRTLRVWRLPIALASIALLAISVVVFLAYQRTTQERDRAELARAEAIESEARATLAETQARKNLAEALIERAHDALLNHQRANAELLAARALEEGPNPQARGVLSALASSPRPRLRDSVPLDPCSSLSLTATDGGFACIRDGEILSFDPRGTLEQAFRASATHAYRVDSDTIVWVDVDHRLWQRSGTQAPQSLAKDFIGQGGLKRFGESLVSRSGPRAIFTWSLSGSRKETLSPCGEEGFIHPANFSNHDASVVLCLDGRVTSLEATPGSQSQTLARLPEDFPDPFTIASDREGKVIVVGSTDGELATLNLATGEVHEVPAIRRAAIEHLSFSPDGSRILVVDSLGFAAVYDRGAQAWLASFPTRGVVTGAWTGLDKLRLLGSELEDWRLPVGMRPNLLPLSAGVAGIAVDRELERIAMGLGDGGIEVRALHSGEQLLRARWQDQVAKSVSFSPDGRALVVATIGDPHLSRIDLESGARTDLEGPNSRRVFWLDSGILSFPYAGGHAFSSDARAKLGAKGRLGDPRALDASALQDASGVVFIDERNGLWVLHPPAQAAQLAEVPEVELVAARDSDEVYLAQGRRLHRLRHGDLERDLVDPFSESIGTLALSPDGAHLGVGTLGGEVVVIDLRTKRRVLGLVAHANRVSALAFTGPHSLVSGSWDASVRYWDFGTAAHPDAAQLERQWGLEATP